MPEILKQLFWSFCFYSLLLLFVVGIGIVNALSLVLPFLCSSESAGRILRKSIYFLLELYCWMMEFCGTLVTNRRILNQVRQSKGGQLIIANHPSILDAPLLLSCLPGVVCVFKSTLKRSLFLSHTTKIAGYLSNDEGMSTLRELVRKLKDGEQILLFPEGTRSEGPVINPLNKGYALAALRAEVPLQLICIHSNTTLLSKKQHFLRSAHFPVNFTLQVGPTIEPGNFKTVNQLNAYVEDWFRTQLESPASVCQSYLPAKIGIVEKDESLTAKFTIPADPFYCRGHMPGRPIVPAYAQMAWIHEILRQKFPGKITNLVYTRMKFIQPLVPLDNIQLVMQLEGPGRKVTITRGSTRVTTGRVRLEYERGEA